MFTQTCTLYTVTYVTYSGLLTMFELEGTVTTINGVFKNVLEISGNLGRIQNSEPSTLILDFTNSVYIDIIAVHI